MHFGICDRVLGEMILECNLIDLINGGLLKLIGSDIDAGNVLVALKRILQSSRVTISDLVAANVQMANRLIRFKELSQRFTEHVSELVR